MTFQEFLAARDLIESEMKPLNDYLNSCPKGAMGLTPDSVKLTPQWQTAYKSFHSLFASLRKLNAYGCKVFKSELRDYSRRNRRA